MPAGEEVVSLIVAESAGGSEDENEDDNGVEEAVANGDAVIDGADAPAFSTSLPPPRTATASAPRCRTTRARAVVRRA